MKRLSPNTKKRHAELVSASGYQVRQIPKQVRDDEKEGDLVIRRQSHEGYYYENVLRHNTHLLRDG